MGFPPEVKEQALIACKRHCVICEESKGKKIECHHIVPRANGGENTFDNCIPLCFDCHEEIGSYNPKHPKGNKFSRDELRLRRDNFYARVQRGEIPKESVVTTATYSKYDTILYNNIRNTFSSSNLNYYLTEYDLGNDFDNSVFAPLMELEYRKNDPEYEFVDEEIETYKLNLLQSISNFLWYKSINTFPTNLGTQAIRTWKNDDYDYREKSRINQEFNDLASDIWQKYCELVKVCKRKL